MSIRQLCFTGMLAVLILAATLQGQSREKVARSVSESSVWAVAGDPTEYDQSTIDKLSARMAPVLKIYGVDGVTVQRWKGPSGSARVTLYEMIDTSAAYGLFTWTRNAEDPSYSGFPVGAEGFRTANGASFWQSKYVVTVAGPPKAIEDLSRVISENIFGESRKPPVSELLPPNHLVQGTEKYILSAEAVGRGFGMDPAKFGFEDSVEAATARYSMDGASAKLLLLLYPTQHLAKKYSDAMPPLEEAKGMFQKRVGPLIAIVQGGKDSPVVTALLADVYYESKVTWNEPKPDINIAHVILTIFSFIGVALLFTLVAGVSFGGLRIFVKARYPDRVFDRAQDMEIIQLKLMQGVTRKELSK